MKMKKLVTKVLILSLFCTHILPYTVFNTTYAAGFNTDCTDTVTTGIPQIECEALGDIYNALDGDSWIDNTNWGTAGTSLSTWFGITLIGGKVNFINLRNNNLSGTIPSSIDAFSSLQKLYLSQNNITGGLPSNLGNIVPLTELRLDQNSITGPIPTSFSALINLKQTWLHQNSFSGTLDVFSTQNDLTTMYIEENDFNGSIPTGIISRSGMKVFRANGNNFTGSAPEFLSTGMTIYKINGNHFDHLESDVDKNAIISDLAWYNAIGQKERGAQSFIPVTIEQNSLQQDPTDVASATFDVTFDEAIDISTLVGSDFTFSGSTTAVVNSIVQIAPNDGTSFQITVDSLTDGDTVEPILEEGTVLTHLLVKNYKSSSIDNSVSFTEPDTDDFVIKVNTELTTAGKASFTIPTYGLNASYNVDCNNDGVAEGVGVSGDYTCDYSTLGGAGIYTIRISDNVGDNTGFRSIYFYKNFGNNDRKDLVSIEQWGAAKWLSMDNAFYGTENMQINAIDAPDLSNVTSTKNMFKNAKILNADLDHWNTSNIINMSGMFDGATLFDGKIGSWNTLAVTDMSYLFNLAKGFNQDIGDWDTDNVINMSSLFSRAEGFNQDISLWNTAKVLYMDGMFYEAYIFDQEIGSWNTAEVLDMGSMFNNARSFNKNIGNWNTGKVTKMDLMFQSAYSFNQDIGAWNTINVTDMNSMFYDAQKFNQNIGLWNTSKVKSIAQMFRNTPVFNQDIGDWDTSEVLDMSRTFWNAGIFNQDISDWDVGKVVNMNRMFQDTDVFNQNISSWDMQSVEDMSFMFDKAISFNQDIGNWDTRNVANMTSMFDTANAFSQNIGNWDITSLTNASNMFLYSGMSVENYDALLIGWESQSVKPNVNFHSGWSDYCLGETPRNSLASAPNSWNISDGGLDCTGVNFPPTDLMLSSSSVDENTASGTLVGNLSTTDGNIGDTHIYSLVVGTGSEDNAKFTLSGSQLVLNMSPDFENPIDLGNTANNNTYSIRIKTDDGNGGIYEEIVIIDVADVYEQNTADFIITVDTEMTTTGNTLFKIPTGSATYNYNVDCNNDGIYEGIGVTGVYTCDYSTLGGPGEYVVSIADNVGDNTGFPVVYFYTNNNKKDIISVDQWGDSKWTNMERSFMGAENVQINATDAPDLSSVSSLAYMFDDAPNINADLNNWDTSNITDMKYMFNEATSFNGDISSWDTSEVTDMIFMFKGAAAFDQDIGGWDTGEVTMNGSMFKNAVSFNQDIGDWDISKVFYMAYMFENATLFNQDIGDWDTGAVTQMTSIFKDATSFNQDIGNWDTSAVTRMNTMFYNATSFNQDIGDWDTGNTQYFTYMFNNAPAFDQDLGAWDVKNLKDAREMFTSAGLSLENYDSLLIGWESQNINTDVKFAGGSSKYCLGESARNSLLGSPNSWLITDSGKDCTGVNFTPTAISIDNLSIDENSSSGTLVGNLSTIDGNIGDIHTYSFVAGTGSEDNTNFTVSGSQLILNMIPDFEDPTDVGDITSNNTYSVRIITDDANGGTYEEIIVVSVNDLDEIAPEAPIITSHSEGEYISDNTPKIEGTGEIGSTVILVIGGSTYMGTVDGLGSWSVQSTNAIADNNYTILVTQRDVAGNVSNQEQRSIVIDTIKPVVLFTDGVEAAPNENDDIKILTTDDNLVITTLKYGYVSTTAECNNLYNPLLSYNNNTSFSVTSDTYNGKYICAVGKDRAGNIGYSISSNDLEIDLPPVIQLVGSGTVEISQGITYVDLGATYEDTIDGTGSLVGNSTVDTSVLGTYIVTFNYTDSLLQEATEVTREVKVIDIIAPGVPTLDKPKNTTTVTGTAEPLSSITLVSITTGVTCNTIATLEGKYSCDMGGSVISGEDVVVTSTDDSGNYSSNYNAEVFDFDKPELSLVGDETISVEIGTTYTDSGAKFADNLDGTGNIMTSDVIDSNTLGVYILRYNYTDSSGNFAEEIRRVIKVVDTQKSVLSLLGDSTIIHEFGTLYLDPGAGFVDNIDGTGSINSLNTVDSSTLGVYVLKYNYTDSSGNEADELTRVVKIVDTTKPVLSLIGNTTITHEFGTDYVDEGGEFYDNFDGTGTVSSLGTVNTNVVGDYIMTYNYKDSHGNIAEEISRTVKVLDEKAPLTVQDSLELEVGDDSVVISWETDEKTSTQVIYGLTTVVDNETNVTDIAPRVNSHSATIDNLRQCTKYYYYTVSTDIYGNEAKEGIYDFVTSGCSGNAEVISVVDVDIVLNVDGTSEPIVLQNQGKEVAVEVPSGFSESYLEENTCNGEGAYFQFKEIDKVAVEAELGKPENKGVTLRTYDLSAYCTPAKKIRNFDKEIVVTSNYLESELGSQNEENLAIFRYNEDTSKWQELNDCSVDTSTNTVSCTTNHFSTFGVFSIDDEESDKGSSGSSSKLKHTVTCQTSNLECKKDGGGVPVYQVKAGLSCEGGMLGKTCELVNETEEEENIPLNSASEIEDEKITSVEDGEETVNKIFDNLETTIADQINAIEIDENNIDIDDVVTIKGTYNSCPILKNLHTFGYEDDYISRLIDIQNSSMSNLILRLEKAGVVDGTLDNNFEGLRNMSRIEFIKIVLRSHCIEYRDEDPSTLRFLDLDNSTWEAKVAKKSLDLGIADGDINSDGKPVFRANEHISKIEATKILMNMAIIQKGADLKTLYRDLGEGWYKDYVEYGEYLDIFDPEKDNLLFRPEGFVTRESMVDLLYRVTRLYKNSTIISQ